MAPLNDYNSPATLHPGVRTIALNMRIIATQNPDTRYFPSEYGICGYYPDSRNPQGQGCIVGAAARMAHTYPGQTAINLDGNDFEQLNAMQALRRLFGLDEYYEHVVLKWVDCVQSRQDDGDTWGGAIAKADDVYPEAVEAMIG